MSTPPPDAGAQPVQPVTPVPEAAMQPTPAKKSKLPWILGGAALAFLVIIGVVVAVVVSMLAGAVRGPQEVVAAYDTAFSEVDCELYVSITTENYQQEFMPTCEEFEAFAADFNESSSDYVVQVTSTSVNGSTATVETTETYDLDGEPTVDEYTYTLVKSGDDWLIDSIELN